MAIGPINKYETKIATKLLNNPDSSRGMAKSMLWLDNQMLKMKWRIIQLKLRAIAKTMGKSKGKHS